MINSIFEAFSFDFFVRGLLVGVILAIIYSIIGIFIVLRKESNITHTISNFSLLGISIGLFFGININIASAISSALGSIIIIKFQNSKLFSHDSIMEFMSQVTMALSIIIISQLSGYRSDINSYLFGNILALSKSDFLYTLILSIFILIILIFFRRLFIQVIISPDLSRSKGINTSLINFIFMITIGIAISLGIKIVGVLLIGAFIVIPPNIAKIFSFNLNIFRIFSVFISVFATFIGLISAYLLDFPAGSSIILVLGIFLVISIFIKKILKYFI